MMFFQPELGWSMLESLGQSAGSGRWNSLQKKKQRGSVGARLLPLRCLSQFFLSEEKINCLKSEFFVYLSPVGWPGIYSKCFSQLDGDKDSLLLDGGFSFLIAVKLIRDN